MVKEEDIIATEHLERLDTLTQYVVPRSSKKLHEDNEYALYTVTLFKKMSDNFKIAALEKGFQDAMRSSLFQWCYSSYGEVFSAWMHFCAVRIFAESILRYGLLPSFLSAVISPSTKSEKKVRSILEDCSGNVQSIYWKSDDDVGVAGLVWAVVKIHILTCPLLSMLFKFTKKCLLLCGLCYKQSFSSIIQVSLTWCIYSNIIAYSFSFSFFHFYISSLKFLCIAF